MKQKFTHLKALGTAIENPFSFGKALIGDEEDFKKIIRKKYRWKKCHSWPYTKPQDLEE